MSLLGLQRDGSGPLLVWLHGFTQTKDSGHEFRSILAGTYEVLTIDLPGHGQNAPIDATLDETADLLAEVLPNEPFVVGGYSMGGRVALHFARRHQRRLAHLVLLSTTAGIKDPEERAARRDHDNALADHLECIGVAAFLDEWLTQSIFAALPTDALERSARSHNAKGLANSLRFSGTGTQAWLGDDLATLKVPTTIVVGANDAKFISEARVLHEGLVHSRVETIDHAGHATHLEQPAACAAVLLNLQPQ